VEDAFIMNVTDTDPGNIPNCN